MTFDNARSDNPEASGFNDDDRAMLAQAKAEAWPTGWLLERLRIRRGRHAHRWGPWREGEQSSEYRDCDTCGLRQWD